MRLGAFTKLLLMVALTAMLGCGDSSSDNTNNVPSGGGSNPTAALPGVYTLTNTSISNSIREFQRNADGTLTFIGDFTTGGNGDASDLSGASGSLIFQSSTNRFYAVNAGSNTISAMVLGVDGTITVLSTISSNGVRPVSITAFGDFVYVLNYGDASINAPASISGFNFTASGLVPINGSTQLLSTAHPDPAQIGFHPTGTVVIVTERATNNIETFQIDSNGNSLPGVAQGSNGATPGGFSFTPAGLLVVSEANNFTPGQGSASVYNVNQDGTLNDLSVAVGNGQTGTAYSKVFLAAPYAFFSNNGSDNISTYTLDAFGIIGLSGSGNAAPTGDSPTELGISSDALYLYSLNTGDETITGFRIASNGVLTSVGNVQNLPVSSVGLVVR